LAATPHDAALLTTSSGLVGALHDVVLQLLAALAPQLCAVLAAGAVAKETLHTPVSGKSSSTRSAACKSPASAATTERTCSKPVAIKKVGARP
jgi:hypothetical protein